jgi:hypothetical protein
VGADVGPVPGGRGCGEVAIGVGRRTRVEGLHPSSILTSPRPCFAFLLPREMAFPARFRGNEARSDHDFAVSLAIPCVRNMLRERWYSMRRPWAMTECPPVRERRRRCWYAAPLRRFARLVSIFGYMAIFERRFSCVGAPGLRFSST